MEKESIMKALGLAVAAVLTGFVAMASAQDDTNSVYSANVVGVIRKTIAPGQLLFVSIPLDDMESTNAVIPFHELPILSQLPRGSAINIWDSSQSKWITANKLVNGWRGAATNASLSVGGALFVKNGGSSNVVLSLVGEVPEDSSISIPLVSAGQLQACANPYPVSFPFATSALASNAVSGSSVNIWDPEGGSSGTGGWIQANKVVKTWRGGAANYELEVAEGFVFKQGATATSGGAWTVDKPYEWPE